MRLVLHSVFFGTQEQMKAMEDIVDRLKKDVRDQWREKIQKEDSEDNKKKQRDAKQKDADPKKNEEESIFEKTRFGWLLRDLKINTDPEAQQQVAEETKDNTK